MCNAVVQQPRGVGAASGSQRREPLVTPSPYGAVLRRDLKSRFGAPTLLPQRDSCNLLSHTPTLQPLHSPSHGRSDPLVIWRQQ